MEPEESVALCCIISGSYKCANASSGRKMEAVKFIALLLYVTPVAANTENKDPEILVKL